MGDVEVELEKAQAALKAAEELRKKGLCDDAASRLYYAAFHAARASLWKQNPEHQPRTHKGVLILYAREVVQKGLAPGEFSDLLAGLRSERERADYTGARVSRDRVGNRIGAARLMVRHARGLPGPGV